MSNDKMLIKLEILCYSDRLKADDKPSLSRKFLSTNASDKINEFLSSRQIFDAINNFPFAFLLFADNEVAFRLIL